MEDNKLTILIPACNEEENIIRLLNILDRLYPKAKILVCDDSFEDNTKSLVRKHHIKQKKDSLIDRSFKKKHGLTVSVLEGIALTKTEYFVVLDGDFQHPPNKIKGLLDKLRDNDLVIGTRKKILKKWSLKRKLISSISSKIAKNHPKIAKLGIEDPLSGFFGMRTVLANDLIKRKKDKFELEGFKILFDFLKIIPNNAKIDQVYYNFNTRKAGKSKLNVKQIFFFIRSLLK